MHHVYTTRSIVLRSVTLHNMIVDARIGAFVGLCAVSEFEDKNKLSNISSVRKPRTVTERVHQWRIAAFEEPEVQHLKLQKALKCGTMKSYRHAATLS